MKKSRFTEEQIVFAHKQAELGTSVPDVCRKLGIGCLTPLRRLNRFLFVGPAFAFSFLQIPPHCGHPCRSANTSPCRVCSGLSPPSHRFDHYCQPGCAYAQRAMPGAPIQNAR